MALKIKNICLYTDARVKTQGGSVIEFSYIPDPSNVVKMFNKILGKNA